ncbi:hypothetical protein [Aquimarina rhabdastrellae]
MGDKANKYIISALLIGVSFHGTSIFYTLEYTYDALIHLFFGNHYASSWFEPWSYSWYTGFTVMGYPPLVHQTIGLLSYVSGLKFGLFTVAIIGIILFITGVYRFSLLITSSRKAAGYAALLAVFSSSFVETLHVFGQLPSIVGISVLMHCLPEIYQWLKTGKYRYLITSFSLLSVTVTSHHVTPIFGMVFFIFPLIGMVLMDASREKVKRMKDVTFRIFLTTFFEHFWRIVKFGAGSLVLIVTCILPYWINTKNNPITQVPIPHGSRDNFLEVTSSGLVFFLIPWGVLLFFFPYIFYRYYSKRYLFFGLSITMLFVLGTGGTTPVPKILLGDNAFNILTLDRFTLWGSIMSLPLFGEFAYRFVEGDMKRLIQRKYGAVYHRIIGGLLVGFYVIMGVFTMSLGYFRPLQPQKINMLPIVNFLKQDQHDKWRFLTLGFGDQMAWLSAQTTAMTVDGNYHSARRLPELTTRAIERLENSKFRGVEGIGSLQQFLTVPEKYNLKYIFSNDKFYDPILYFSGWQRLPMLENGIMVWEKLNVPPLSTILPYEDAPLVLKLMWGIIPLLTVVVAFVLNIQMMWYRTLKIKEIRLPVYRNFKNNYDKFSSGLLNILHLWIVFILIIMGYGTYLFYIKNETQLTATNVIKAYYDALDFKMFKKAHSYIDPEEGQTLSQYMLEVAVSDGLMSSYAKMNDIEIKITHKTDSTAKAKILTNWVTPLENIQKQYQHELIERGGDWYIKPTSFDLDIPPDQFFSKNITAFYNHGRRRVTTEQTYHEDVLKQPVLEILNAKLIHYHNRYAIVGELQNVDNTPADVVLKGILYDDKSVELANHNAKYHIKHKLMPREITSFKINFEGIAWSDIEDEIPEVFNPDEFTPIELEKQPTNFVLQGAGNVAITDLYKSVSINDLEIDKNVIRGMLFNFGFQEVTIPQLLISYYNDKKELIWVDHLFIKEGIRPQRKQFFEYDLKRVPIVTVLNSDITKSFINGLPNTMIAREIVPDRDWSHPGEQLQPIKGDGYSYIKIEVNNYIGNPK